ILDRNVTGVQTCALPIFVVQHLTPGGAAQVHHVSRACGARLPWRSAALPCPVAVFARPVDAHPDLADRGGCLGAVADDVGVEEAVEAEVDVDRQATLVVVEEVLARRRGAVEVSSVDDATVDESALR